MKTLYEVIFKLDNGKTKSFEVEGYSEDGMECVMEKASEMLDEDEDFVEAEVKKIRELEKILYVGFTQDKKTANIAYDGYNEYTLSQVDYFIEHIKECYEEKFDVDEEYTMSEAKQRILDCAEDYIEFDYDCCTCDEYGEVIDVYAWENSDDYDSIEFVFADGTSPFDCDISDYLKAVEEHIDEIISVIAENIKIIGE